MKSYPRLLSFRISIGLLPRFILFLCLALILQSQQINIYAQQPAQEWVRRFSGDGFASGISIKQDSLDNVYVLLKLYTDSTFNDFGLLKYNSSGNLLWNVRYNSSGTKGDQPAAFAVTSSGDIYITGNSEMSFVQHITTVKFNSAGILQWTRVYESAGPASGANDITLDIQGNIIITGGSSTINNSTSYALTVKYNSNGDTLWARKFNQIGLYSVNNKVVVDDSGNVYTTGYYEPLSNKYHFLTLKYNPVGNLMWYSTYSYDPGYQSDLANCIEIDMDRNVYIAGISHTLAQGNNDNSLLKINSNGNIQWSRVYKGLGGNNQCQIPAGIAISDDGSIIYYATFCGNATGGGGYDIVTLKYNQNGDSIWTRRFGGGVNATQNAPTELKIDKYNNIYVTGNAFFPVSEDDIVTIKYLSTGAQQWVATYNGPLSNSSDRANSICIDTNLNVYVTGISSRYNGPPDILWDAVTIKYSQVIGINPNSNELPKEFILAQNYPNPFNSTTIISYAIPVISNVQLHIYNITGQLVNTLVNTKQNSGYYSIVYNSENLSSGIYFYSLLSESKLIESKKFIIIK